MAPTLKHVYRHPFSPHSLSLIHVCDMTHLLSYAVWCVIIIGLFSRKWPIKIRHPMHEKLQLRWNWEFVFDMSHLWSHAGSTVVVCSSWIQRGHSSLWSRCSRASRLYCPWVCVYIAYANVRARVCMCVYVRVCVCVCVCVCVFIRSCGSRAGRQYCP